MGCSLINQPFLDTTIHGNSHKKESGYVRITAKYSHNPSESCHSSRQNHTTNPGPSPSTLPPGSSDPPGSSRAPRLLETSPDHRHLGCLEVPHADRQHCLPDATTGDALAVQHLGRHQGLGFRGRWVEVGVFWVRKWMKFMLNRQVDENEHLRNHVESPSC